MIYKLLVMYFSLICYMLAGGINIKFAIENLIKGQYFLSGVAFMAVVACAAGIFNIMMRRK